MNLPDHEDANKQTNYSVIPYSYDDYDDYVFVREPFTDVLCVLFAIYIAIICFLSITGNGLVIWIAGFKLKKSINCMWYLSLAVSNFLFGACLPSVIVFVVMKGWILGSFMCKVTVFILVLCIYSSIFFLVIISMDRCVVVIFPVWAQNNRTVKKCSVVIMFTWILATALSIHPATALESYWQSCIFDTYRDKVMMGIRFVFGFAIPVLIIICCYISIMLKLRANRMTTCTKPFKIMTLLIVMFIICWLPHYIIIFLELIDETHYIDHRLQTFGILLAFSNCCMNPLVYTFIGKDPKMKFYNILSKIKNAFEEEGQSPMHGTGNTNQVELST